MKLTSWILGIAALLLVIAIMVAGSVAFDITLEAITTSVEGATAAGSDAQIKIDEFKFAPGTITVPAGTAIHWVNKDDIPHTVVSDDKSFKSKALDTDEEFSFTFTKPGTYTYFCSIHPLMKGKVIVQ